MQVIASLFLLYFICPSHFKRIILGFVLFLMNFYDNDNVCKSSNCVFYMKFQFLLISFLS